MKKETVYTFAAFVLIALLSDDAMAKDLASAAKTYTSTVKAVAQGLSVTGVIAGGLIMQIPGAASFGKKTLSGGILGALCAFGAPAITDLLTRVFGA
jgi:hypothetical protein